MSSNHTRKHRKFCAAVDCTSRVGLTQNVKFFMAKRVDKDQTFAWARAINRKDENGELWMPKYHDRICSKHFIGGKFSTDPLAPNYKPTIFPTHSVKVSESDRKRYERKLAKEKIEPEPQCPPKERKYHPVTLEILSSDQKCKDMCGVPKALFELTYELLFEEDAFLNLEKTDSPLYDRDQLTVYFTKLKTGCTFGQIAVMFQCRPETVSLVFTHILNKHYDISKDLLWWYSREEVDETMPESFRKKYPNTRVILDATEVKIQVPGKVDQAVLCWSTYKHSHTLKFLLGIAPNGQITFVSKGYGGRVTGKTLS